MTKTPISLQDLRERICAKAKAEPSWRFWGLLVVFLRAGRSAKPTGRRNNGAPGSDRGDV